MRDVAQWSNGAHVVILFHSCHTRGGSTHIKHHHWSILHATIEVVGITLAPATRPYWCRSLIAVNNTMRHMLKTCSIVYLCTVQLLCRLVNLASLSMPTVNTTPWLCGLNEASLRVALCIPINSLIFNSSALICDVHVEKINNKPCMPLAWFSSPIYKSTIICLNSAYTCHSSGKAIWLQHYNT